MTDHVAVFLPTTSGTACMAGLLWLYTALFLDKPEELIQGRLHRLALRILWRGWWPAYLLVVASAAVSATWWTQGRDDVDGGSLAAAIVAALIAAGLRGLRPFYHEQLWADAARERKHRDG